MGNTKKIGNATIINIDCMEYMRTLPDKFFDLAVVDPPYGIGDALVAGGTWSVKYQKKGAEWDVKPKREYFYELRRISNNQIIWGGNYFSEFIVAARCCIAWVKPNMSGMKTMSDFELALTSFDSNARVVNLSSQSTEHRIHVTQKPVKLYEWILTNYAKPGQTIFDSHMGSGSSAIACNNLGFEYVGCELDEDYYNAACERIAKHAQQERLFD